MKTKMSLKKRHVIISSVIGIIVVFILFTFIIPKFQIKHEINEQSSLLPSATPKRDAAITEYLASQEAFAWKTKDGSTNVCVFERLDPSEDLFPLSLWVRCGEFMLEKGSVREFSGISIPVLLDYPNELSFFDLQRFSYKIPGDGSLYKEDIETMFPAKLQKKILNYDATGINKNIQDAAREKLLK